MLFKASVDGDCLCGCGREFHREYIVEALTLEQAKHRVHEYVVTNTQMSNKSAITVKTHPAAINEYIVEV